MYELLIGSKANFSELKVRLVKGSDKAEQTTIM